MIIDEAQSFISSHVLEPALDSENVSPKAKAVIKNSKIWLSHFKRVGDLVAYMNRFTGGAETEVYQSTKKAGLLTFEDIREEFNSRYGSWSNERTRLDDFIVGQSYSSYDILIFAGKYDTRSGGIFVIGSENVPRAVFVKATLSGGRYENAWLEYPDRLKYFLKSRTAGDLVKFDEDYVENRTIIQNPNVPIYVFIRNSAEGDFILSGLFKCASVHVEGDGSKWFELERRNAAGVETVTIESELDSQFEEKVKQAKNSSKQSRIARLANAPKKPPTVTVLTTAYVRNADVVAEVLERAGGKCEGCGKAAPFKRKSDGTPYLEVHHKVQLALGGEDTVENAAAVCPNCHRSEHYGPGVFH
jgi:5-methylcytosine-specific restriction protein A